MKGFRVLTFCALFSSSVFGTAVAGSIDSPGAPSAGSGMYTLQNLYDYLINGAPLSVQENFQEPVSGPAPTMKTTKEVGDAVQTLFEACDTDPMDVRPGKKFFCTLPCMWGVRTGGTPVPACTATSTP